MAELPDFTAMAQGMRVVADQMENCVNFPPIQDANAILRELRALREVAAGIQQNVSSLQQIVGMLQQTVGTLHQDVGTLRQDFGTLRQDFGTLRRDMDQGFNALRQEMREGFNGVDLKFDAMEVKMTLRGKANDHNSCARVCNSWIQRSDAELMPLVNPSTTAPIDDFPKTGNDINALSTRSLGLLLEALGVTSTGSTHQQMKARFRVMIGLRESPA